MKSGIGYAVGAILGFSTLHTAYHLSFDGDTMKMMQPVLRGISADQSWGRFWEWDPKENGALMIVIWNAVILHVRLAGMIRDRGLALCAISGNIITAFSWFGVNMLGVGLHSYGFMDRAFWWLIGFALSQLLIILFGYLWKPRQRST